MVLEKAKKLIGLTTEEDDALLELYIEIAEEEVREAVGNVPRIPDTLLAQMVNIKYQRRGTESLSNSNYAGNGETFLKEYPSYILDRIESLKKANKRLRTL